MHAKNILLFFALFLSLSLPATGPCKMRNETKIRVGTPPYEVLAQVVQTNMQQQSINKHKTPSKTLYLVWLADSDPRITQDMILTDSRNKIYSIRNLGFQIDSTMETVDFGVRHLRAPVLLITGNNDNQAIQSALKDFRKLDPETQKQLQPLRKIVMPENTKKKYSKNEFSNLLHQAVEKNVDHQVNLAVKRYKGRLKTGRLVVVGGVLDLNNSYGMGKGRLVIININGETNDTVLRQHHFMAKFDKQMLKAVGRKPRKKEKSPAGTKKNE